ncbi:uncharacterized protein LOC9630745 isoform X1 [Selaginella moellendorffii]|uniref:uncharacterized protein LOC9630745 isoform X1 n=1 Tax=Selaginella moellendorffii TaxID=88036 RepID=UPI000D1C721B|nr:uncharacterized protein LOC9630745 isoform X1 [Selaginella moellendorffii]|eukprot:XP_024517337.1 uncharacterized protein LOC9630745 isoform X1 [Selaginella moellendorffii]
MAASVAGLASGRQELAFGFTRVHRSSASRLVSFKPARLITACADDPSNSSTGSPKRQPEQPPLSLSLENVNPVDLGRKSRKAFDDVWQRIKDLGQFTGSSRPRDGDDNVLVGGPMCEFTIPNAEFTTLLVVGATSRVGRVLIRKLQLRGYKVKALVRNADPETLEMLPRSVQIVVGDLGEPETLKAAVEGCNKIICCAAARSYITADLYRVDNKGVQNLSTAFQDYNHRLAQTRAGRSSKSKLVVAKFSKAKEVDSWEMRRGEAFGGYDPSSKYQVNFGGTLDVDENNNADFSGFVPSRGGYVEMVKSLSFPSGFTLDRYEGLVLCVCGDGKIYSLILETSGGEYDAPRRRYYARFLTRLGYSRIRIPFTKFRPMNEEDPPLDLFLVDKLAIRFEPRKQRSSFLATGETSSFKLLVDYIKALPTGEETDFILVSCSAAGVEGQSREKLLRAKQAGEAALRNSGLGYTIIRPGPLMEEPGGQRALVFDQGNRITQVGSSFFCLCFPGKASQTLQTQGISCADVADVCVKALHDPTARNKSFDVCYEYTPEAGQGLYELVAHVPDKSNNYLTPALSVLEKNT